MTSSFAALMLMNLDRYYNKTNFSGLETHIANSYANPLLQLFKFIPLVRNLALHHAAITCLSENCLLCEMGFLFDMLDKAEGQSCQATNFLKTFSSIPEGQFPKHGARPVLNISISCQIRAPRGAVAQQSSYGYDAICQ